MAKDLIWLRDIRHGDAEEVGLAAEALGMAGHVGIAIANGFVVTTHAAQKFFTDTDLLRKIEGLVATHKPETEAARDKLHRDVMKLVKKTVIPEEISHDIMHAYLQLAGGHDQHTVAVKAVLTTAAAHERPHLAKIAHFFNIQGEANVATAIRDCWTEAISHLLLYTAKNPGLQLAPEKIRVAVLAQEMVKPSAAGILLTRNPESQDKSLMLIEAVYGHPEALHHEHFSPDVYVVNSQSQEIVKDIHAQSRIYELQDTHQWLIHHLDAHSGHRQKISDEQILALARMGATLVQGLKQQLEIDWAIVDNQLLLLDIKHLSVDPVPMVAESRQVIGGNAHTFRESRMTSKLHVLARGVGVRKGIYSGYAVVLKSAADLRRELPAGAIVVMEHTSPEFVPSLRRCGALVIEEDGHVSHAAMLARELGIPCVVGVTRATEVLKVRAVLTVDGGTGLIYQGSVRQPKRIQIHPTHIESAKATEEIAEKETPVTATSVLALLEGSEAFAVAPLENADGVVLDSRLMLPHAHIHPLYAIEHGFKEQYLVEIVPLMAEICSAVSPDPVFYQLPDWTTEEYRQLKFGPQYEQVEGNPWLGMRGARKFLAHPELLELEMEMIKLVRNKHGHRNLHVMLPLVRTAKELLELKRQMATYGVSRSGYLKLMVRIDTPIALESVEELLEIGIDGVAYDVPRLWSLMSGFVSEAPHAPYPQSFWQALLTSIKLTRKHKVEALVLQDSHLKNPITESLVGAGVKGLALVPSELNPVRSLLQKAEHAILAGRTQVHPLVSAWH